MIDKLRSGTPAAPLETPTYCQQSMRSFGHELWSAQMKNLVLATDFSEAARAAYTAAASIARTYEATIQLVHEVESAPFLYLDAVNTQEILDRHYEKLKVKLENETKHVAFQGCNVTPHLGGFALDGERLVDFAEPHTTDLIVLSTHGRSGLPRALLGSFAENIARHAAVPVLTVRRREVDDDAFQPRSILVPFDFSENAKTVLPLARSLGERYSSKVTLLHVLPEVSVRGDWGAVQERLRVTDETAAKLEDRLESLGRSELPGVKVMTDTRYGDAHAEIVNEAKSISADIIIMATHGWTGLKRMYFGSVAEKVIRTATCSVLTFRPQNIQPEVPEFE